MDRSGSDAEDDEGWQIVSAASFSLSSHHAAFIPDVPRIQKDHSGPIKFVTMCERFSVRGGNSY